MSARTTPASPTLSDEQSAHLRLSDVLGYQLVSASLVTNGMFDTAVGTPLGLSRVEYSMLMLIRENPGLSAARLSEVLAVTPPYVAARLALLERHDLVARATSKHDRRSQSLALTPAGVRISVDATRRLVQVEKAIGQKLSPVEILVLKELLRKVATP
ncbi:MAG: winged helix-turn-helix transcriptional regulator [Proteobacteria bacterium]|nr:winged helix-turn-helix transcriptional regulator [Pseudomonadota bacterium]